MDQNYERTKLKKSITMRKRGKEAGTEESKEAVKKRAQSKKAASPGYASQAYQKFMPSMLQKKVSARTAFDVTLFAASVWVIYKYGQSFNNYI